MLIVGGGLSGLIAAHMWPRAKVVEAAQESDAETHRALLRFRSPVVGEVTGIPFKPVEVNKEIYYARRRVTPSIAMANRYALKVTGRLMPRSIWNLTPATRYVAPPDFVERLKSGLAFRVEYGTPYDFKQKSDEPIVSTVPLGVTLKALGYKTDMAFNRRSITVRRFKLRGSEVYQTIYYPTDDHTMYRASITGDILICEFIGPPSGAWTLDVISSFGLAGNEFLANEEGNETDQKYGKIVPVEERRRRAALLKLTTEHDIYSLGRFGTWRNILLDDIVKDVNVIDSLIISGSYATALKSL